MMRRLGWLLACVLLAGQVCRGAGDDAREAFESGKADAVKVVVVQVNGESVTPVAADQVFHEGDQIRVRLESNFPGFLYVINQTPGGETRVLLPGSGQPDGNGVGPHQPQELPTVPNVIKFDAEKGIEVLQVVVARGRVTAYDDAVKNHRGVVQDHGDPALEAQAHRTSIGVVALAKVKQVVHMVSRGLFISTAPDPAAGSYVAVNGDGRLGGQDVALFEVCLQHR